MPAASHTKRIKGVSIYRPFIYGSIATPVNPDKKPPNLPPDHTHQWTVCVKGVNDTNISYFIKKVTFKLHDTYANPVRTVESPPFEVSETGWGEFEIQIKIHFHSESGEKPQSLFHFLQLHPYTGDEAERELARQQRRPVLAYMYDEIVFNEPTEAMYELLTTKGTAKLPSRAKGARGDFVEESEAMELDRLGEGIRIVEEHIKKQKELLVQKEKQVAEMREKMGLEVKGKK
ncbi:NuA4 histone H4 acetyltransferase complex and the SWR1 complex subunit [Rhizina undulata]